MAKKLQPKAAPESAISSSLSMSQKDEAFEA